MKTANLRNLQNFLQIHEGATAAPIQTQAQAAASLGIPEAALPLLPTLLAFQKGYQQGVAETAPVIMPAAPVMPQVAAPSPIVHSVVPVAAPPAENGELAAMRQQMNLQNELMLGMQRNNFINAARAQGLNFIEAMVHGNTITELQNSLAASQAQHAAIVNSALAAAKSAAQPQPQAPPQVAPMYDPNAQQYYVQQPQQPQQYAQPAQMQPVPGYPQAQQIVPPMPVVSLPSIVSVPPIPVTNPTNSFGGGYSEEERAHLLSSESVRNGTYAANRHLLMGGRAPNRPGQSGVYPGAAIPQAHGPSPMPSPMQAHLGNAVTAYQNQANAPVGIPQGYVPQQQYVQPMQQYVAQQPVVYQQPVQQPQYAAPQQQQFVQQPVQQAAAPVQQPSQAAPTGMITLPNGQLVDVATARQLAMQAAGKVHGRAA